MKIICARVGYPTSSICSHVAAMIFEAIRGVAKEFCCGLSSVPLTIPLAIPQDQAAPRDYTARGQIFDTRDPTYTYSKFSIRNWISNRVSTERKIELCTLEFRVDDVMQ